jgi:GH43 family beta-xylosidase
MVEQRYRPLFPDDVDQGDPYLFAPRGDGASQFAFYVYVTGEEPANGMAFPAYGSNDLSCWTRLGHALRTEHRAAHWAPCVDYVPALERPYVMLYSRSQGTGDLAHVGHKIYRADALQPEGPFLDSGHLLTPDDDFAIDPDVYRTADGALKLAYAVDFVDDEPYGTGIVEAAISEDLTRLLAAPRVLARPQYDWQVYDAARVMPWKHIPGVDWGHQSVRWHTIEAPVGGLVSPRGEPVYLYSGGCFFDFYAVGVVVERGGVPRDETDGERSFVARPDQAHGFYGPGHCSWQRVGGRDLLMLHARFGSPDAKRQMCLAQLHWNEEGLPIAEPFSGPV